MVGELMTLPLRVGVRATQLWLRAAEETVAVVAGASRRVIGKVVSSDGAPSEPIARAPEPASQTMPPPSPAVQLYETGTKGRTTVLETVERELRISTGSG